MIRRVLLVPLLVLPLMACITTKPRSAAPTSAAFVVAGVPVRTWGDNTCGSGALSAVLNHYGDPVTEAELDALFPKGRHGGVVSLDLLLEARRRGFEANLVRGDAHLVTEKIRSGTPVILMLRVVNLPGARGDYYHYVIADGFDPERNLVRFQFGDSKTRWVPLERLRGAWAGAGNATLLVEPMSLETALRRAVLLEEKGSLDAAREAYATIAQRHPDAAVVWTNLGNVDSRRGDVEAAERAYRRAVELDPDGRDPLNNLAWLLYEQGRHDEAEPFARRAVEAEGPDPHFAWDTLAHVLAARGACAEAEAAWRNALASPSIDRDSRRVAEQALLSLDRSCVPAARDSAAEAPTPTRGARILLRVH